MKTKPVKSKSSPPVAQFLYEIMYWQSCMKIHLKEKGKEFLNKLSNSIHNMTGAEQHITLYHPNPTVYVNVRTGPLKTP